LEVQSADRHSKTFKELVMRMSLLCSILLCVGLLMLAGCGSPKAIDAGTIAAYKQAGANNHGGYRSDFPDKWLGAWQFEWSAGWRDPEKNLPGFVFSEAPKSKLPDVAVPFGLTLAYKDPTGGSLKQIAHLKNLTLLDARELNLTNAGLKELAPLTSLTTLAVGGQSDDFAFRDGAAGLKELTALTNLTTLDLEYLNYRGAGLKELAALKHLTTLHVSGADDGGLKELATLTNLTTLGLDSRSYSDAGLRELAALKNLKRVRLGVNTQTNKMVTEAGFEQLKQLMPDCEFHLAP
jgi:hypothetical protein